MSPSSQARSAIRRSDRKAAQLLGVTLTRDHAPMPPKRTLVGALRKRLGFLRAATNDPVTSSSSEDSEDDSGEDIVVWDVPNPFGPPDPTQAHLRALIQAEIARTARYESIGPLDSLHDGDDTQDEDEDESDGEDADDEDEDDDEDENDDYDEDYDEDFDSEDDDQSESEASDDDKPATIALPRLLPIPLRFIPSMPPLSPPPSPSPSDGEDPAPLADVAQDIAEADERARKAKRDAHRSRSKALAILGPEASSVL